MVLDSGDCGERSTSTVIAPIFSNEILALAEAKLPQLRQEGLVLSGDRRHIKWSANALRRAGWIVATQSKETP